MMVEQKTERNIGRVPGLYSKEIKTFWALFGRGPETNEADAKILNIRTAHGDFGYYSRLKKLSVDGRQYNVSVREELGLFRDTVFFGTRIIAQTERVSPYLKHALETYHLFIPKKSNGKVYLSVNRPLGERSSVLTLKQGEELPEEAEAWIKGFVKITQNFPEQPRKDDAVHRPDPEKLESFLRTLISGQDNQKTSI